MRRGEGCEVAFFARLLRVGRCAVCPAQKNEGKAAVDLLGSYFGKSGASWIMQVSPTP